MDDEDDDDDDENVPGGSRPRAREPSPALPDGASLHVRTGDYSSA